LSIPNFGNILYYYAIVPVFEPRLMVNRIVWQLGRGTNKLHVKMSDIGGHVE